MKKIMIFILLLFMPISLLSCNTNEKSENTLDCDMSENIHYEIGDIILKDGSIIKVDNLSKINSINEPMAVIIGLREDGRTLGMGIYKSKESLQWAKDNSNGYHTMFTSIIAKTESENAIDADFIGNTNGSDNWNKICLKDKQAQGMNYPAYQFANTYGQEHQLNGSYTLGWYIPSIAELCMIYQNKNIIDFSLQKIYESNYQESMNGLETNWYWASSQSESNNDYAWFVHFFNGYVSTCPKNFTNLHVIAVRAF